VGSGFEGFDFSHEGVQQVIGLLIGFVSAIAGAPCCFLYLNHRIPDFKKKEKSKKEEAPYFLPHSAPSTPPVIEITNARCSVHDPPSPPTVSCPSGLASWIPRLRDERPSSPPGLGGLVKSALKAVLCSRPLGEPPLHPRLGS